VEAARDIEESLEPNSGELTAKDYPKVIVDWFQPTAAAGALPLTAH
jgi:hypothetical protein